MTKIESTEKTPKLRGMFKKFLSPEQLGIVEIMLNHGMNKAQIFEYFSKNKGVVKPHWSQIHEKDEGKLKNS